jgi:hypothetical protein
MTACSAAVDTALCRALSVLKSRISADCFKRGMTLAMMSAAIKSEQAASAHVHPKWVMASVETMHEMLPSVSAMMCRKIALKLWSCSQPLLQQSQPAQTRAGPLTPLKRRQKAIVLTAAMRGDKAYPQSELLSVAPHWGEQEHGDAPRAPQATRRS